MNNTTLVLALGLSLDSDSPSQAPSRNRVSLGLCLPERLPTMSAFFHSLTRSTRLLFLKGILQREARGHAPKAYLRSLQHSPEPSSPPSSESGEVTEHTTPDEDPSRERKLSMSSIVSAATMKSAFGRLLKPTSPKTTSSADVMSKLPEVELLSYNSNRQSGDNERSAIWSFAGSRTARHHVPRTPTWQSISCECTEKASHLHLRFCPSYSYCSEIRVTQHRWFTPYDLDTRT